MRLKMDGWLKRRLGERMSLIIRRSAGLSSAVRLPRLLNQLLGHPCHALAVNVAGLSINQVGVWVSGWACTMFVLCRTSAIFLSCLGYDSSLHSVGFSAS